MLKKTRIMALFIALMLLLSAVAGCVPTAVQTQHEANEPQAEKTEAAQPAAEADGLHGFKLLSTGEMPEYNAKTELYEHEKTGARVMFVLNDDQNRAFGIGFNTVLDDSTGKPHILEHASCASSEKYPAQDVFFAASNQTYLTEINAYTDNIATMYYVTSMDETQLERLTDMYLDCCFNSSIRTDPNYFHREGWRYELEAEDAELKINGIVYNEMQAAYSNIEEAGYYHLFEALFPDTPLRFSSGGNPDYIPDLTNEALIAFYDKCYTPSNSLTVFYGDVEQQRFLQLLDDGYFSKYERSEPLDDCPIQQPLEGMTVNTHEFPVSEDAEDLKPVIYYGIVLDTEVTADIEKLCAALLACQVLADPSSELMLALENSGIGSDYSIFMSTSSQQPVLVFEATDADDARAEEFTQLINEKLGGICEHGFDKELLAATFAEQKFSIALSRETRNAGSALLTNILPALSMDNIELFNSNSAMLSLEDKLEGGCVEDVLRQYVLNNTHRSLCVEIPAPGLFEKKEQEKKDKLAAIKAGMSEAEISALVEETASFNEWADITTPQETVDKLTAIDAEDVKYDAAVPKTAKREIGNVNVYTADVEAASAGYNSILLDVSHLTLEELRLLKLYTLLFGRSTANLTQAEASIRSGKLLYSAGAEVNVTADDEKANMFHPTLELSYYAMDENAEDAAELAFELLRNIDVEGNIDYLEQLLQNECTKYCDADYVSSSVAGNALFAVDSEYYGLIYALKNMDYYAFLKAAAEQAEKDEAFAEKLTAVRDKALRSNNAILTLAGDASKMDGKAQKLAELINALPDNGAEAVKHELPEYSRRIAFAGSSTVDYSYQSVRLSDNGLEDSGTVRVLAELLAGEYTLPEIRFKGGAYGGSAGIYNGDWLMFNSYRDRDFANSLNVYSNAAEFIENLDLESGGLLENYKLSTLAGLTLPYGMFTAAYYAAEDLRTGTPQDKRARIAGEVGDVTGEDIKACAALLKAMEQKPTLSVVSTAAKLEGSKEKFDEVVTLP